MFFLKLIWTFFIFRAREQLWNTFLSRVGYKDKVDIRKLKERPLNGREIKTAVRLAKVNKYI
jgi:hypothetical protein